MYPYLTIGPWHPGTFGLLLWLAAVIGTVVLHKNFVRNGVDADALNVVALVVVSGILGAKLWHEMQDVPTFVMAIRRMGAPGWKHPLDVVSEFLFWFRAGFAWFGGMLAGIAMLMWQGRAAQPEGLSGWWAGVRMLDLASPAAAVGYGVGRIGCLTSGDGDYGIKTTLPWGVHMAKNALVPTADLVQPTPVYELIYSVALGWLLWRLGSKSRPVGWLTGLYPGAERAWKVPGGVRKDQSEALLGPEQCPGGGSGIGGCRRRRHGFGSEEGSRAGACRYGGFSLERHVDTQNVPRRTFPHLLC